MLDMVKCYEKIRHSVVEAACRKHGFSAIILRICLAVYAGPRVLSVDGATTLPIKLGTSIVAGCSFATTLLRVVLVEIIDLGWRLYPS
eukprot:3444700-Karenia_brevis.AAC.1